jgi:hypothetical protein
METTPGCAPPLDAPTDEPPGTLLLGMALDDALLPCTELEPLDDWVAASDVPEAAADVPACSIELDNSAKELPALEPAEDRGRDVTPLLLRGGVDDDALLPAPPLLLVGGTMQMPSEQVSKAAHSAGPLQRLKHCPSLLTSPSPHVLRGTHPPNNSTATPAWNQHKRRCMPGVYGNHQQRSNHPWCSMTPLVPDPAKAMLEHGTGAEVSFKGPLCAPSAQVLGLRFFQTTASLSLEGSVRTLARVKTPLQGQTSRLSRTPNRTARPAPCRCCPPGIPGVRPHPSRRHPRAPQ